MINVFTAYFFQGDFYDLSQMFLELKNYAVIKN